MSNFQLIGPFAQLVTMSGLSLKGALSDNQLEIISQGGMICHDGIIVEVGKFDRLKSKVDLKNIDVIQIEKEVVALPGFIDAHTHICFAGSRAADFALRNGGASYLEIAKSGGGIWDTVTKTRVASKEDLKSNIIKRANHLLKNGVTTIEIKSGYGLSVDEELKMLRAIKEASGKVNSDIIATCLAAHIFPKDHSGNIEDYLHEIVTEVFPIMAKEKLSRRVDAFVEEEAYNSKNLKEYLNAAKKHNFDITIHADQFSTSGSELAVQYGAISADHLEASTDKEIKLLANSNVISTALPGASLGLGMQFTPARKILDAGGALAIASDWNPGSAPMGDLLTSASILSTYEKLSAAEVLAGITFRASAALNLFDRGILERGLLADFVCYPTNDYKEILYNQGQLKPSMVWKKGIQQ